MDEIIVVSRETTYEVMDDSKVVRPCYYGLRILALWQPENAHCFMKAYNKFGYAVFLFSAACLCYFLTKKQRKLWSLELNILSALVLFGVHFLYHKWYQRYGKYDQLVRSIIGNKVEKYRYCRRLSKLYSLIAFLLWLVGLATQILFFLSMPASIWEYSLYLVIILYVVGWWTSWLTIYSFICHIHLMEVKEFEKNLALNASRDEMSFEDLLSRFKELKNKLKESQERFHVVISVAVFLHLVDISVYTISYFQGDYKIASGVFKYPTVSFIFCVFFDVVSILIKLLPAAKVSSALHDITLRVGDLCMNAEKGLIDERLFFLLHQLIHISEQDMGYKILGVKITMRLTVSLLIGFITVLTTLFKFLTPHSTDY